MLAVHTNIGLFIFDTKDSFSVPSCEILWRDEFECESSIYVHQENLLFIKNKLGKVKRVKLGERCVIFADCLDTLIETGCISFKYSEELNSIIMLAANGLWSLDFAGKNWKFLFKVLHFLKTTCKFYSWYFHILQNLA